MIRFTLNGTQIEIEDGENRTLLEYLRNVKCMKGTKEACSTGHCGACSVLVDGRLTRSCVTFVRRLDGKAVETIENAPNDTMLQVIQHSFLDVGAVQCGFCTPGMVMATKALLLHYPAPTEPEICGGHWRLQQLHRNADLSGKLESSARKLCANLQDLHTVRAEKLGRAEPVG